MELNKCPHCQISLVDLKWVNEVPIVGRCPTCNYEIDLEILHEWVETMAQFPFKVLDSGKVRIDISKDPFKDREAKRKRILSEYPNLIHLLKVALEVHKTHETKPLYYSTLGWLYLEIADNLDVFEECYDTYVNGCKYLAQSDASEFSQKDCDYDFLLRHLLSYTTQPWIKNNREFLKKAYEFANKFRVRHQWEQVEVNWVVGVLGLKYAKQIPPNEAKKGVGAEIDRFEECIRVADQFGWNEGWYYDGEWEVRKTEDYVVSSYEYIGDSYMLLENYEIAFANYLHAESRCSVEKHKDRILNKKKEAKMKISDTDAQRIYAKYQPALEKLASEVRPEKSVSSPPGVRERIYNLVPEFKNYLSGNEYYEMVNLVNKNLRSICEFVGKKLWLSKLSEICRIYHLESQFAHYSKIKHIRGEKGPAQEILIEIGKQNPYVRSLLEFLQYYPNSGRYEDPNFKDEDLEVLLLALLRLLVWLKSQEVTVI